MNNEQVRKLLATLLLASLVAFASAQSPDFDVALKAMRSAQPLRLVAWQRSVLT